MTITYQHIRSWWYMVGTAWFTTESKNMRLLVSDCHCRQRFRFKTPWQLPCTFSVVSFSLPNYFFSYFSIEYVLRMQIQTCELKYLSGQKKKKKRKKIYYHIVEMFISFTPGTSVDRSNAKRFAALFFMTHLIHGPNAIKPRQILIYMHGFQIEKRFWVECFQRY